jgi:hypothetical protein
MEKELSIGYGRVRIWEYKGGVVLHEDDKDRFNVLFTIKGPSFFQEVLSGL